MKNLLISTAMVACAASTASAQVAFEAGSVELNYYTYISDSSISTFDLGVRGAYSLGGLGLQLDGSVITITDFSNALYEYAGGVHLYKPLDNGNKFGAYASVTTISVFNSNIYSIGAEAMMSFGALDVEAAIGFLTSAAISDGFWTADIDAYYAISSAIELNAGLVQFFNNNSSFGVYSAGISYSLPNLPLSIGTSYTAREGTEIFGINASFAFGPSSDERLFGSREYPIYIGF